MITVRAENETRTHAEEELPLAFGGADAQLPVAGDDSGDALAWIDRGTREDGSSGLLAGPGEAGGGRPDVLCNGAPLLRTTWLHAGDLIRAGSTLLRVRENEEEWTLVLERAPEPETEATAGTQGREPQHPELIHPIPFVPRSAELPPRARRLPRPGVLLAGLAILVMVCAGAFLLSARVVTVQVEPEPDRLELSGGFLSWEADGRHLLLPGRHRLQASAAGHHDLDVELVVGPEREQAFEFELSPLPGLVRLLLDPSGVQARVSVDEGEPADFEGELFELEAGEHSLAIFTEGYLPHVAAVFVRGRAEEQELRVELVENAAELRVATEPSGASVRIDGRLVGNTPVTIGLAAGRHQLELSMPGRVSERRRVEITPERDMDLGVIALARSPGKLSVSSTPAGALVSVNGSQRGSTPLNLDLPSGHSHQVRVSLAGHRPQSRTLLLAANERQGLSFELEALIGRVRFDVAPGHAELFVDGEPLGAVPESIQLTALPHQIELRAVGHEAWTTRLTPDVEHGSLVSVTLRSEQEARKAAMPSRLRNAAGMDLVLIEPGEFTMGASRREPGRRSNEKLRSVKITRPYYLATTEVTNRQFAEFDSGHSSGVLSGYPLDGDDQPVVNITWQQAARFCNLLSRVKELPLAYVENDAGEIVGVHPLNAGYRLPTEAEWEFAARTIDGGPARRYSWGDQLPPPEGSANLGDSTATGLLPRVLASLSDGRVVGAEVGRFAADRRGLFDMTGNVAEWAHDVYIIPPATSGTPDIDPHGPDRGELHAIRGSSFMHSTISELRLSFRDYGKDGRPDLGFRVARFADQGKP